MSLTLQDGATRSPSPNPAGRYRYRLDPVSGLRRLDLSGKLVLGFTGFVREWHGLDRVIEVEYGS